MSKVILICGKICSGKSYYANQIKEKENAVILSTDEATYDLIDNQQGEFYNQFALGVNAYLKKKAVELVKIGCTVILDWGFWTAAERAETTEYFKSKGIAVEWHYMDMDDETWRHAIAIRNQKVRNGQGGSDFYVDEGLLHKVLAQFEAPAPGEMDVWHKPFISNASY